MGEVELTEAAGRAVSISREDGRRRFRRECTRMDRQETTLAMVVVASSVAGNRTPGMKPVGMPGKLELMCRVDIVTMAAKASTEKDC